jgi:hypothetical protein
MPLIDYVTQKPIVCECGESELFAIVYFTYGSRVDCETCGRTGIEREGLNMDTQKAVNPQEVATENVPDPMTECIWPNCHHRRYWHGDGTSGPCTRADCSCEGMTE